MTDSIQPQDITNVAPDATDADTAGAVDYKKFGGARPIATTIKFRAQQRFATFMIEFRASLGAVLSHGYSWVIIIVKTNDDLTTEPVEWPPEDVEVNSFVNAQLQVFLTTYAPKRVYLATPNIDVLSPSTYDWGLG